MSSRPDGDGPGELKGVRGVGVPGGSLAGTRLPGALQSHPWVWCRLPGLTRPGWVASSCGHHGHRGDRAGHLPVALRDPTVPALSPVCLGPFVGTSSLPLQALPPGKPGTPSVSPAPSALSSLCQGPSAEGLPQLTVCGLCAHAHVCTRVRLADQRGVYSEAPCRPHLSSRPSTRAGRPLPFHSFLFLQDFLDNTFFCLFYINFTL